MTITTNIQGVFCGLALDKEYELNPQGIKMVDTCFDYLSLDSANLSNITLDKPSFFKADCSDAFFVKARLKKANFKEVYARYANFSKSKLAYANFDDAHLSRTNFNEADLTGASLQSAFMEYSDLTNAILKKTNLKGAFLGKANLTNANLSGSDLTKTDLIGATLTGANLTGAIGLARKQDEMELAQKMLARLDKNGYSTQRDSRIVRGMSRSLKDPHCFDDFETIKKEEFLPGKTGVVFATLEQYVFSEDEKALEAIRLVAAGQLSVLPE